MGEAVHGIWNMSGVKSEKDQCVTLDISLGEIAVSDVKIALGAEPS